jgi:hypothetical protein
VGSPRFSECRHFSKREADRVARFFDRDALHHGLWRVDHISFSSVEIARRSVDSPSEPFDSASESLGTATRAFDFA